MHFCHKHIYGKDLYYPANGEAKMFVEAFPGSSGKRKSLTLGQLQTMKKIGISFEIKTQTLQNQGDINAITGNKGL